MKPKKIEWVGNKYVQLGWINLSEDNSRMYFRLNQISGRVSVRNFLIDGIVQIDFFNNMKKAKEDCQQKFNAFALSLME